MKNITRFIRSRSQLAPTIISKIHMALLSLGTGLFLQACAATSSVGSGTSQLKIINQDDSEHVFSNTRLRQSKNDLILYGSVEHRHVYFETDAHIDIAAIDRKGEVWYEAAVSVDAVHLRGRFRDDTFSVRFNDAAAKTADVRIAFHSRKLGGKSTRPCYDNRVNPLKAQPENSTTSTTGSGSDEPR